MLSSRRSAQKPRLLATDEGCYACLMTTEAPFRRRVARFMLRVGIRLCVFLVLYALSIGPMYWQWYEARFVGGNYWVAAFYEPLLQVARIEPVGEFLSWYIDLWTA